MTAGPWRSTLATSASRADPSTSSSMVFVSVSAFDDEPLVAAGLEAGAAAYLLKTASRESICLDVAAAARAPGASAAPRPVSGLTH